MPPRDQPESDGSTMSFGEHLHELRGRLFKALIVPLPLAIAFFVIASYLRDLLIAPLEAAQRANGQAFKITALSPAETIMTDMKLAVIAALSLSAPWLVYQLWKFVEPGLFVHERRYVHFLAPLSAILTVAAFALFYWILLPFTLLFLVGFGAAQPKTLEAPPAAVAPAEGAPAPAFAFPVLESDPVAPGPGEAWISANDQVLRIAVPITKVSANAVLDLATQASDAIAAATSGGAAADPAAPRLAILEVPLTVLGGISQEYRLSEYISFALLLLAGSVVAFQMPVVILLLGWIGLVSPKFLREKRRWALFLMSIIAAVVTPPDVTSMFLLLVPLVLLYELGIVLLVFVPAHKVAQGRVFSVRGGAAAPAQTEQPSRSEVRNGRSWDDGLPSEDAKDDEPGAGGGSS
jgi:sec-independent protein translocase protein TatC